LRQLSCNVKHPHANCCINDCRIVPIRDAGLARHGQSTTVLELQHARTDAGAKKCSETEPNQQCSGLEQNQNWTSSISTFGSNIRWNLDVVDCKVTVAVSSLKAGVCAVYHFSVLLARLSSVPFAED